VYTSGLKVIVGVGCTGSTKTRKRAAAGGGRTTTGGVDRVKCEVGARGDRHPAAGVGYSLVLWDWEGRASSLLL
jgi:hypothetical protein